MTRWLQKKRRVFSAENLKSKTYLLNNRYLVTWNRLFFKIDIQQKINGKGV